MLAAVLLFATFFNFAAYRIDACDALAAVMLLGVPGEIPAADFCKIQIHFNVLARTHLFIFTAIVGVLRTIHRPQNEHVWECASESDFLC